MKSILPKDRKGQLGLGNAPGVVLIVLFLFMLIGTAALILETYSGSFTSGNSYTVTNETVTQTEREAKSTLNGAQSCNPENFVITQVLNGSATDGYETLTAENYTIDSDTGTFYNLTGVYLSVDWLVSYTYDYAGVACNVTEDLTGEIEDNTSIAGMVLTISFIGIVLTILIGIFYVFTRRKGM